MQVSFFYPRLNHLGETLAYYFIHQGYRPRIVTHMQGDGEHPTTLRRLQESGLVDVSEIDAPAEASDLLVFPLVRAGQIPSAFTRWREKARRAAFLSGGEYAGWKHRAREALRSWPHHMWAGKAIYLHAPASRLARFPFLLQKPVHVGAYIHPQLFFNDAWRKVVFGSVFGETPRRYAIGFIGCRNPAERARQLEGCARAIREKGIAIVDPETWKGGEGRPAAWFDYGDEPGQRRGLEPMDYITLLTEMDFCISPSGYLGWTHRTVEAVIRGAIPIIADPDFYNLDFKDGENAIIVKGNDWHDAVRRALALSADDVGAMRRRVLELREQLLPDVVAREFVSQLVP